MDLAADQRAKIEEALDLASLGLDAGYDSFQTLVKEKGLAETAVILHTIMTGPKWSQGKLATLFIAAVRRIAELESKLAGEPPF